MRRYWKQRRRTGTVAKRYWRSLKEICQNKARGIRLGLYNPVTMMLKASGLLRGFAPDDSFILQLLVKDKKQAPYSTFHRGILLLYVFANSIFVNKSIIFCSLSCSALRVASRLHLCAQCCWSSRHYIAHSAIISRSHFCPGIKPDHMCTWRPKICVRTISVPTVSS